MEVVLQDLTKKFGSVVAVDHIDLDIKSGEFVAFLGPSGCGKTTTLLMLAGIYKPSDGEIRFDKQTMNRVPPRKRNIGMVFQSYALYPHMSAFANMAFPLRLAGVSDLLQMERVTKVADLMGIDHLLDRKPGELSGGQQQRVALGRALVKEPDLLLFDEPLSNLDARLRLIMRGEIKRLQKDLGITSVYVTHDQIEAMTMADRIAVMMNSKLQAFDTPDDLYNRPRTQFIAGFVGNPPMNFFAVTVQQENGNYVAVTKAAGLRVNLPADRAEKVLASGIEQVTMGIRPQDIHLDLEANSTNSGEVFTVEPLGDNDLIDVRVGDYDVFLLSDPEKRVNFGEIVHIELNTHKVQFFDPTTERSLLWA